MPLVTPETQQPKSAVLMQRLRKQILDGQLKPGSRLPTQRQLCEQYGVGESTALAVMTRLVGEGLIVRRRGQGSFVNEPAASTSGRVIDVVRATTDNVNPDRAADLQWIESFSLTAKQRGYKADWHYLRPEEAADLATTVDRFSKSSAVIALLQSNLGPEFPRQLHARGVPVVAVWMRMRLAPTDPPEAAPYPQVAFDRRKMAQMAVEHLVKLGRQRIAFLGGSSGSMLNGYLDAVRRLDLPVPASWIVPHDRSDAAAFRQSLLDLVRQKSRPDALLFMSDYLAYVGQLTLLAEGIRVPDDMAVMACCDGPSAEMAPVPISAAAIDREALCRAPFELLENGSQPRQPGEPLPPFMLPLHTVVRKSCGEAAAVA